MTPRISLVPLIDAPISRQVGAKLTIRTNGPGCTDLTTPIGEWIAATGINSGLLTVFCPHTSASIIIQENTDPDVQRDIVDALEMLAPRHVSYRHHDEGPDDMPAHLKTVLTASSIAIPVVAGNPVLGIWQAVFLVEHRDIPHARNIVLYIIGN